MPLLSPVTLIGEPAPDTAIAPGLQVAVNPVIALPPLLAGGVKAMLTAALPTVAVPMVGAPGTVRGVTFTPADGAPVPTALIAETVHEYAVPFVSPLTVIGEAWPVAVAWPALQLTL